MANGPETDTSSADNPQDQAPEDKKLANLVNSAVSAHVKRHMAKFGETFESMLSEKLAGLQPAPKTDTINQAPEPDDGGVRKELESLKAQLAKERQQGREKEAFSQVRAKLSGKVRPDAVDTVLKVLKHDGRIVVKKDGSASFRHEDMDMDVEEGLSEWLKTSEGAMFAPPPTAQKRGNYGVRPQTRTGQPREMTPAEKTAAMLAERGLRL